MPNFKENPNAKKPSGFKMKYDNSAFPFKESPAKTKLGRWLMGRKKHVADDGSITITDRDNKIVKQKANKKSSYTTGDQGETYSANYRYINE